MNHPVEPLETRRLLAAAAAVINDGVLVIEGTRRADTITVTRDGRTGVRVDVSGRVATFRFRDFDGIRVRAGAGDDQVAIGTADRVVARPCTIAGGDGDDLIVAGAGDDSVEGGGGDDLLSGVGGRDLLRGGAGRDGAYGGDDADTLYGDAEADVLYAGAGDDRAYGGKGDDRLHDGPGDDRAFGNAGLDRFLKSDSDRAFRDRAHDETIDPDTGGDPQVSARGTSVNVHYTLTGDATLDGSVDFGDLAELVRNYDADTGFITGDFTYDGVVDFDDLVKLARNYGTSLPGSPPAGGASLEEDLRETFESARP
jgi:Ca2+-binding RTX toxin-like protein